MPGGEAPQNSTLRRRLAAVAYEFLPVAAIALLVGLVFVLVAQAVGLPEPRLNRPFRWMLFAACYGALATYFVWCWRHGQTLPMKAWRLRVVATTGAPITYLPLVRRYLLASFAWGTATFALLWLREHPRSVWGWIGLAPLVTSLVWTRIDRDRQALYDRLSGTRLVSDPKPR
jgi:uncharacterized RDD family membrane protein YckC